MPEGHVIHRIAGELTESFGGLVVESSSPQGRFELGAQKLDGLTFDAASAWGKHMFVRFVGEELCVNIHLGLLGKFFFTRGVLPADVPVTGAVRWRLGVPHPDEVDAQHTGREAVVMDLRGPNVCALRTPDEVAAIEARLGPDPLRPDADPDVAWGRIRRSARPIGVLLMDQAIFAGVGNIYRAEVLFRHRLDPQLPGKSLRRRDFDAVWADLVDLMPLGVRSGRIDTVRPEHSPEAMGRPGRVDAHGGEVYVYRRTGQPCLVCGTTIAQADMAGRNLFWCPRCQGRRSPR